MARYKEFNQQQVLDKAMQLFWRQGYESTSVDDLVQCTGIGRGSLYDTFGDKHSLYLAALDHYQAAGKADLDKLRDQSGPFLPALQQFFQAIIEEALADSEHKGCFMVNATLETAPNDPEVAIRVQAAMRETEEAFYYLLIKAQAAGELAWTSDPHQLARFLLNTLMGLRVMARAQANRTVLEDIIKTALSILS